MDEGKEFCNIRLEEIINSYELNVSTVTSLIRQVVRKVKIFHREQTQMAEKLKDILAKNRSLRRKDFDTMIADIQIQQAKREKGITHMIENFCKEEEETVAGLREILSGKSSSTIESFNILKKKMLGRPKEREKRLSRMLKNFHRDQEEIAVVLRKLLEKGPAVRIKDLKAMIRAFQIEHQDEISGVDEILEEFERVKDEIGSQWQNVIATVSKAGVTVPHLGETIENGINNERR